MSGLVEVCKIVSHNLEIYKAVSGIVEVYRGLASKVVVYTIVSCVVEVYKIVSGIVEIDKVVKTTTQPQLHLTQPKLGVDTKRALHHHRNSSLAVINPILTLNIGC